MIPTGIVAQYHRPGWRHLEQLPVTYHLEGIWVDPWPIKRGRWEPNWRITARMPNGQRVIYRNRKAK